MTPEEEITRLKEQLAFVTTERDQLRLVKAEGERAYAGLLSTMFAPTPTPVDEIRLERLRQVEEEGWSFEHDDVHDKGELAQAAACYAVGEMIEDVASGSLWPWHEDWWKPATEWKDHRRDLIKAGALIVAEIERLDRKHATAMDGGNPL